MMDLPQQINVLCIIWVPGLNTKFNMRPYVGLLKDSLDINLKVCLIVARLHGFTISFLALGARLHSR